MNSLFTFLIQASAAFIVFYLVYWVFLRKETYYSANRFYLLFTLLLSLILPMAPFHYTIFVESADNTNLISVLGRAFKDSSPITDTTINNSSRINWQEGLLLIYLTGLAFFLSRLLFQTIILIRLIIIHRPNSISGIRIVENEKYGLPFSFFNIVFINPKFHTQDDLPEILAHEKVHIRENHWADLLFIELLTVIFWFNPFIWFFERSIKQNHEYLADQGVISNGSHVGRYQALLVNQLMGMQIIGITNNLNFALNTNRLKMMTKKKTPKINAIKLALVLPALAILLAAFAEPTYKVKETEIKNPISSFQKGEKELVINGKVVREETGEPLHGATILIKGTTIGTVADKDGKFTLVDPNPIKETNTDALSSKLVISYVGFKSIENVVSASGGGTNNANYTFKMKEEIVFASATFSELKPPPPLKSVQEVLAPPPPPPVNSNKNKEQEVFFVVEDMPQFPGGSYALSKYVQDMTEKYNLKGLAKIGFTVNTKGKVTDIKVVDAENDKVGISASEIIKTLPDWKPGSQRSKSVAVKFVIAVEFR